MSDFYSFNIDYSPQKKDNWCWCACFSWIIQALGLNTPYRDQWQVLLHYTEHINKLISLTSNNQTYIEAIESPTNLLITFTNGEINNLIESLLKLEYEKIEIPTRDDEKLKTLNSLFNYKNLKTELKKSRAPWVVTTNNHMYLISGFGQDTCNNYVLVSDPNYKKKETFYACSEFINGIAKEIRHVWKLQNPNGQSIEKDAFVDSYRLETTTLDPSVPSEFAQIYFDSGIQLLKLNQKINNLIQNYQGNKSFELKNLIRSEVLYSMNHLLCENFILKSEQTNIHIIEKLIEDYFKTSELNINLNDFVIPQELNSIQNLRLFELEQEIFVIPDDAVIRIQNLSETITNNNNLN